MNDSGISSDTDAHMWKRMFSWKGRKRKSMKKQVIDTVSRLTSTVDQQTKLIQDMTSDSRHRISETKPLEANLHELQTSLRETKKRLCDAEEKLHESNTARMRVESKYDVMQQILAGKDGVIQKKDDAIAKLQERFVKLLAEKSNLDGQTSVLRDELSQSKALVRQQREQIASIDKDKSSLTDALNREKQEKTELNEQQTELRDTLSHVRSRAHETEVRLETENELLKFDVVMLTKSIKKKNEKIEKLNLEKKLVLSYYAKQMDRFPWFYRRQLCHKSVPYELSQEAFESVTYKNKLIRLQQQLYRKERLEEELVSIIKEHDPNFRLAAVPGFQLYCDSQDYKYSELYDQDVLPEEPIVMTTSRDFCKSIATVAKEADTSVLQIKTTYNAETSADQL